MGQIHIVIFAPRSVRDLEATVRFISHHADGETAERLGNQLIERALSLRSLPERGRIVPETGLPYREIICKSYRILYRLQGDNVEIVRFWHAARGVPEVDSDEFRRDNTTNGR
jgi:plasmid stabilization system protein ParE